MRRAAGLLIIPVALTLACSQPSAPATPKTSPTPASAVATTTTTAPATATATASATSTATPTATAAAVVSTSAPAPAATAVPPAQPPAPAATAAPAQPAAPSSVTVDIFNFAFESPTVARGGSITWVNKDMAQHDVIGPEGTFRSSTLDAGNSFTARFDTSGTFSFYCSIHPFMTGTVTVR